jgi:hypothetical protein
MNGKTLAPFVSESSLLLGNVYPGYGTAIVLGHVPGKTTPSEADIENMIAFVQVQFFADKFHFALLSLFQIPCAVEVSAAVLIVRIEKSKEEFISEVVVSFCNLF